MVKLKKSLVQIPPLVSIKYPSFNSYNFKSNKLQNMNKMSGCFLIVPHWRFTKDNHWHIDSNKRSSKEHYLVNLNHCRRNPIDQYGFSKDTLYIWCLPDTLFIVHSQMPQTECYFFTYIIIKWDLGVHLQTIFLRLWIHKWLTALMIFLAQLPQIIWKHFQQV